VPGLNWPKGYAQRSPRTTTVLLDDGAGWNCANLAVSNAGPAPETGELRTSITVRRGYDANLYLDVNCGDRAADDPDAVIVWSVTTAWSKLSS